MESSRFLLECVCRELIHSMINSTYFNSGYDISGVMLSLSRTYCTVQEKKKPPPTHLITHLKTCTLTHAHRHAEHHIAEIHPLWKKALLLLYGIIIGNLAYFSIIPFFFLLDLMRWFTCIFQLSLSLQRLIHRHGPNSYCLSMEPHPTPKNINDSLP